MAKVLNTFFVELKAPKQKSTKIYLHPLDSKIFLKNSTKSFMFSPLISRNACLSRKAKTL